MFVYYFNEFNENLECIIFCLLLMSQKLNLLTTKWGENI